MRAFTGLLLLGLTCCSFALQGVRTYRVVDADFRAVYNADPGNASRRTFDEYLTWVKRFYDGFLFQSGWTENQATLLNRIDERSRDRLMRRMNVLGFKTAAEWAKSKDVRRIDLGDVQRWGKILEDSAPNAAGLTAAIDRVSVEIATRLKKGPPVPLPKVLRDQMDRK